MPYILDELERRRARPPVMPPAGGAPTGLGTGTHPGSATVPGYTPDYKSLALNDPTFTEFRQHIGAEGVSDAASRQRAVRDLLIRFGAIPEGVHDPHGDINEETRALAAGNPHSVMRQQQQEYDDFARATRAALRARGLASSGQALFETQRLGQARSQAEHSSRSELLRSILGIGESFASGERQRQLELSGQLGAAMQRQTELNPSTPSSTATLDPGMVGPNGEPVYRGPDGRYYDLNGAPINARAKTAGTVIEQPLRLRRGAGGGGGQPHLAI